MPWIRFEDTFPEHPKLLKVGPRAAWLHVRAIGYCSRLLTDGLLPVEAIKPLGGTPLLVERLVAARLWHKNGDGWLINDYLKYQPSKAQVLELREKRADAGRKGGSK